MEVFVPIFETGVLMEQGWAMNVNAEAKCPAAIQALHHTIRFLQNKLITQCWYVVVTLQWLVEMFCKQHIQRFYLLVA